MPALNPQLNEQLGLQNGFSPLDSFGVIQAQGMEAAAFLHNMLTQDVLLQPVGSARLAALCSPKGRMLASGWVVKHSEQALLWVLPKAMLDATLKRLRMFVLRMKVVLSDASAAWALHGRVALSGADGVPSLHEPAAIAAPTANSATSTGGGFDLLRHGQISLALQVQPRAGIANQPSQSIQLCDHPEANWLLALCAAGVALVQPQTVDMFVPQMLNYESLGGVNFKKGCYPGQEVVARSQFRGAIKRRGQLLWLPGATLDDALQPGSPIQVSASNSDAGDVDEAGALAACNPTQAGVLAFACLQTQVLSESASLLIAGRAVQLLVLPYPLLADV